MYYRVRIIATISANCTFDQSIFIPKSVIDVVGKEAWLKEYKSQMAESQGVAPETFTVTIS